MREPRATAFHSATGLPDPVAATPTPAIPAQILCEPMVLSLVFRSVVRPAPRLKMKEAA